MTSTHGARRQHQYHRHRRQRLSRPGPPPPNPTQPNPTQPNPTQPNPPNPTHRYFSATPEKGTCQPGDAVEVTFSFSPPVIEETYGLDVGQWSRTFVRCVLKGGYAPEGNPDHSVKILLEGYIRV